MQDTMGKIYPVGMQSFERIREDGYYYVDKTELIYTLVKTGHYYFLSEPPAAIREELVGLHAGGVF